MSSVGNPTQVIVEEVAAAEGVDPLELQPPLFEAIDTDALDSLIDSADVHTTLQFTYCEYKVTIDGNCNVDLDPVSGEPDPAKIEPAD